MLNISVILAATAAAMLLCRLLQMMDQYDREHPESRRDEDL